MIVLEKEKLEKRLGKLLKKGSAVGLDIASRTGYCLTKVDETQVYIDFGFISLKVKVF